MPPVRAFADGVEPAQTEPLTEYVAVAEVPEVELQSEEEVEAAQKSAAATYGMAAAATYAASKIVANKNSKMTMLSTTSDSTTESAGMAKTLKLATLFFLWYALNICYNITNKKVLNAVALPWIQSTMSLWMGVPVILFLWLTGIRKAPKLTTTEVVTMTPIATMHALGHVAAVISFAWGAVSFTQIVKAAEPVFTAGLSGVFLGQVFHPFVYAALIPIIGGVAIASLGELSFSWMAFGGAMISNITFAFRAILSKKLMGGKKFGENMNASNVFAVMTILAAIVSTPFAIWQEGHLFADIMAGAVANGISKAEIYKNVALSGLAFFLYNEVAFQALDQVNAVTHAVANTIKRVAIILASVVVFGTPLTPTGMLGSAIAIAGVLVYSLVKGKYPGGDYGKKKEAAPAPTNTTPPATA